jgi:hypothetical protein
MIHEDKKPTPLPSLVADRMNVISGDLQCSLCGAVIAQGYENDNEAFTYNHVVHFCPKIKFNYDYNSPKTLIEQYNEEISKQLNPIE